MDVDLWMNQGAGVPLTPQWRSCALTADGRPFGRRSLAASASPLAMRSQRGTCCRPSRCDWRCWRACWRRCCPFRAFRRKRARHAVSVRGTRGARCEPACGAAGQTAESTCSPAVAGVDELWTSNNFSGVRSPCLPPPRQSRGQCAIFCASLGGGGAQGPRGAAAGRGVSRA